MNRFTALIIGEFTSGIVSKLSAISLSILVIAVNIYFVLEYVIGLGITNAFFIIFVVLTGILYLLFCAYLTIDMVMTIITLLNVKLQRFNDGSLQVITMTGCSMDAVPGLRSMFTINYSLYTDIDAQTQS